MADPKIKPEHQLETSGVRSRRSMDDEPGSTDGTNSLADALVEAVRGALELARVSEDRVVVVLRGDPSRGMPVRMIEGVVTDVSVSSDGRQRVVLRVTEDASQVVLIERIVRVQRA